MEPCCSFCKIAASRAEMLLEGPGRVFICSWCVEAAVPQVAGYRMNHGWTRQPHPNEPHPQA